MTAAPCKTVSTAHGFGALEIKKKGKDRFENIRTPLFYFSYILVAALCFICILVAVYCSH